MPHHLCQPVEWDVGGHAVAEAVPEVMRTEVSDLRQRREFEIIPEPLPTSSASAATGAQTLLTCPCSSGSNRVRGTSGVYTFRSEACAAATSDMNRRCFNSFCTACCNSLECDCVCAGSPLGIDYICSCGRIGYFCTGRCT